jgi:hypothetical protein
MPLWDRVDLLLIFVEPDRIALDLSFSYIERVLHSKQAWSQAARTYTVHFFVCSFIGISMVMAGALRLVLE